MASKEGINARTDTHGTRPRELRVIATIIKENKKRLRRGEVLNIQTRDGFLVVFEEEDPDSGDRKTVTLIDTFDSGFTSVMVI